MFLHFDFMHIQFVEAIQKVNQFSFSSSLRADANVTRWVHFHVTLIWKKIKIIHCDSKSESNVHVAICPNQCGASILNPIEG